MHPCKLTSGAAGSEEAHLANDRERSVSLGAAVAALGVTGFLAGFVGPMLVNPGANQGLLVGLFISGPAGAALGLLLALLSRALRLRAATRHALLLAAGVALLLGTLYFCLPAPAHVGDVIEARIEQCDAVDAAADAAAVRWRRALAQTPWAKPPPDWERRARERLADEDGRILTLQVERRRVIYENRRPWNRGVRFSGPWSTVDEAARYYAHDARHGCPEYLERPVREYFPSDPGGGRPDRPSPEWPPTDPAGFLSLLVLGPVPAEVPASPR